MLTALLAPFSAEHRVDHQQILVDEYYANLTRESLQSQFRSDLRDALKRQGLQTALGRRFDECATLDESGRKVWTRELFAAFLSTRLSNREPLTALLWRCLIYNAHVPFATPPKDVATLDSEAWMQAAALLATDTSRDFGRNRATMSLYGASSPLSEKKCTWRRFVSLASEAQHIAQTAVSDDAEDWRPPDLLEEVAMVVSTQLPLDMETKIPAYQDIQPKIRKLEDENSRTSEAANTSLSIPYQDFVCLLTAIMSIRRRETAVDGSGEEKAWPEIDLDADGDAVSAAVRAILECGGVRVEGKDVNFERYSAFCDRFSCARFSFDTQICTLWQALLLTPGRQPPSGMSPQQQQQGTHPPTALLQAFTFLSPFDNFDLQRSRIAYTSSHITPHTHEDVIKALTKSYHAKLLAVHGITTAANDGNSEGEPALFTVLTSSPLWYTFENGTGTLDFQVGDHFILQLAPRAHVFHRANAEAKLRDIVDTAGDVLSFGRRGREDDTTSSGFVLDFAEGTATILHSPGRDGGTEAYIGIEAGRWKSAPGLEEAWRERIRVQRVEVYDLPGGVAEDLEVER